MLSRCSSVHLLNGGSDTDHECIFLSNDRSNNIANFSPIYCKLGVNACVSLVD